MATIVESRAARTETAPRLREPTPRRRAAGLATGVLLLVPAALTLHQSFNAGGFFVGAPSLAAAVLAVVLGLRMLLAAEPFAGFSRATRVCAAALALLAVWTLASAAWSHSPSRAVLAFDRTLLYLLALVTAGSLLRTDARLRWAVRGFAAAAVVVCAAALATRVAPDVFPTAPGTANDRLSFPLTYWNALGLLAAIAIVLCLHLAASERERLSVRSVAAGAVPLLAGTLYFTFSRGALAAGVAGLVVYLVVGRPRLVVGALLAVVPTTAGAAAMAYGADLLAASNPTSPAAASQGHRVGLVVLVCAVAAGLIRLLVAPLDSRVLSSGGHPRAARLAAGVCAATAIAAALAFHVPGTIETQYHHFVDGNAAAHGPDLRARFGDASSPQRLHQWRVAEDAFRDRPLTGTGAGTYEVFWNRDRPDTSDVVNAHSLYLQTLAELGVPGLVLLAAALLALLGGLARRARGPQRPIYAALLGAAVAWALHAAVDWDWEMPAVTVWLFALGGIALAAPAIAVRRGSAGLGADAVGARRSWSPGSSARIGLAIGALLLAATPALAALSQVKLDSGVDALKRGDCGRAIDRALAATSLMPPRPEPWEVVGYCDARLGYSALAERAFDNAIRLDRDNWQLHYGLALVRGAAGADPRPAAREALRLNPRGELPRDAARRFATRSPATWRARARRAPLAIQ